MGAPLQRASIKGVNQMFDESNSRGNYSTPDTWAVLDDLQALLARANRQHERGDSLNLEDILREASRLLDKARPGSVQEIVHQSVRELLHSYWAQVTLRKEYAPTGFARLNTVLGGGLEAKRLIVLLGAPGAGKTTLANQIADHVADAGRPVLYVTSEDHPHDLLAKTLARIGHISYTAVLKGWETERAKIDSALTMQAERLSSERLCYIDASGGLSRDAIKARAHMHFSHFADAGRGLLVVDYLQRLARAQRDLVGTWRDLREVVTLLTEQLRAVACDLDCCVIALASQNRASGYGSNGTSALASAKESGDIEYTADVIMALTEDKDRKTSSSFIKPRLLRIDKNRQGDVTGDYPIPLDWQPDRQMFTEAIR